MWPDRVSNSGPPTYESGALPIETNVVQAEWLQFFSPFNSISVILGRWEDDNEMVCAMELRLQSE